MKWFLYLISILWVAAGVCYILYTQETRDMLKKIMTNMDRKLLAAVPAAAGVLFIFAAFSSQHSWFIILLGVLALVKGGFIYLNPNNQYEKLSKWFTETTTDQTFRLIGIVALVLGTALFSWIL